MLLPTLLAAQEQQIWGCQQDKGSLLNWERGRWEQHGVVARDILLRIDGEESSFTQRDSETPLSCTTISLDRISCIEPLLGAIVILIDPATGKMGYSFLSGALSTSETRDSVVVSAYSCTRF